MKAATALGLLAVTMTVGTVTACGTLRSGPTVWDLRTPTYPSDIDPERHSAIEHRGASSYTVILPHRSIEGRFALVRATSPVAVELDPYRSIPTHIDTVSLAFDAADQPDDVLSNLETVRDLFDVDGVDLTEMEAFVDDFRSTVTANGGEIDDEDFVPGSSGFRTITLGVVGDEAMKVVLLIGVGDDEFSMTIVVRFDNGTTDDWT